ncbi:MAG: DUF6056 family protein [Bacteroidales bacterium]
MKQPLILVLLFFLSLLGFFCLNYNTNIAIDDFAYKHIFTSKPAEVGLRVQSFSDLFMSMYNHYFITNGRLLMNGLAQLFLMSDNKLWFDIANTMVFGLFIVLVFLLIGVRIKAIKITSLLALITMCWFLLPGPNHTLLWLDGSFNYLWSSVFVMFFLVIYHSIARRTSPLKPIYLPFLFILGLVAGGTHEVITLGVSGALFFYYLFNFKKFRGAVIPLVIGFFIGTLLVVLAPGNMVRVHSGGVGEATATLTVAQRIWGMIASLPSMLPVVLLLVVLVFQWWKHRVLFKETISTHFILLVSVALSLGFILVVGAFQERVFFGVSLFAIIVLMQLIDRNCYPFFQKGVVISVGLLSLLMAVEFYSVFSDLKSNKAVFDRDEMVWRNSNENVFELRDKRMNRFVSTGLGGMDRNFWSNKVMSWYYGKEYMVFIPSDIYNNTFKTNKIEDSSNLIHLADSSKYRFYFSSVSKFIVTPISDDDILVSKLPKSIVYDASEPIPVRNLTIRERVVKFLYGNLPPAIKEERGNPFLLETKQGKYIFFKAPSTITLEQLKSIRFE